MSEIKVGDKVRVNEKYAEYSQGKSDGSYEELVGQEGIVINEGRVYLTVQWPKPVGGLLTDLFEERELDLV